MISDQKNKAYLVENEVFHCGTSVSLHFIGGKWKAVILWYLRNGKLRFSELRRLIPDITDKMLSIQLIALKESGLINRKQCGTKPPFKVEYSLTKRGKSLIPTIQLITEWGIDFAERHGKLIELD